MFPFGFIVGAAAGAAGAMFFGRHVVEHGRPLAKAALKATLAALHEARVRGAEIGEAAEDLYAEAKSEVTAEVFEAAMAAATAKAAELAKAAAMEKSRAENGLTKTVDDHGGESGSTPRTRAKPSGSGPANG
jgi:hypothetical protein